MLFYYITSIYLSWFWNTSVERLHSRHSFGLHFRGGIINTKVLSVVWWLQGTFVSKTDFSLLRDSRGVTSAGIESSALLLCFIVPGQWDSINMSLALFLLSLFCLCTSLLGSNLHPSELLCDFTSVLFVFALLSADVLATYLQNYSFNKKNCFLTDMGQPCDSTPYWKG